MNQISPSLGADNATIRAAWRACLIKCRGGAMTTVNATDHSGKKTIWTQITWVFYLAAIGIATVGWLALLSWFGLALIGY
jgi:hypothetical protein